MKNSKFLSVSVRVGSPLLGVGMTRTRVSRLRGWTTTLPSVEPQFPVAARVGCGVRGSELPRLRSGFRQPARTPARGRNFDCFRLRPISLRITELGKHVAKQQVPFGFARGRVSACATPDVGMTMFEGEAGGDAETDQHASGMPTGETPRRSTVRGAHSGLTS
jgi:hypothetical protein